MTFRECTPLQIKKSDKGQGAKRYTPATEDVFCVFNTFLHLIKAIDPKRRTLLLLLKLIYLQYTQQFLLALSILASHIHLVSYTRQMRRFRGDLHNQRSSSGNEQTNK